MRTIVYEKTFDAALKEIEPSFERADEFLRGVEWTLIRNPKFGICLQPEANLWMIPAADVFPESYAIWYTFDTIKVYFLSISRTPVSACEDQ
jgi:hypothetical protein